MFIGVVNDKIKMFSEEQVKEALSNRARSPGEAVEVMKANPNNPDWSFTGFVESEQAYCSFVWINLEIGETLEIGSNKDKISSFKIS